MRVYTVHIDRLGRDPDRDLVLVKEGFSWPAFLFSGLWAFYHRAWFWGVILIAANIALGLILNTSALDPLAQGVVSVGFAVIIGFIGNDLWRSTLSRRGYRTFGVVSGADLSTAERRFLDLNPHWVSAFR